MSDMWYYSTAGQQQGPVSLADLQQLVQGGHVGAGELAWKEGMAQWTPIGQIPELAPQYAGAAAPGAVGYQSNLGYYTPQGPSAMNYAGFWIRVGAYIIDYIICYIPNVIITVGIQFGGAMAAPPRPNGQPNPLFVAASIGSGLVGLAINWLYFSIMESSKYQATVGKMAVGVIVTDANGARLSFGRATGRFFAKMLSFMLCFVGVIMVAFNQYKQGLHDQMAGTLVVYKNLPRA